MSSLLVPVAADAIFLAALLPVAPVAPVGKVGYGVGQVDPALNQAVFDAKVDAEGDKELAKIELERKGKVRRAKLYYLRGTQGKAAKVKAKI